MSTSTQLLVHDTTVFDAVDGELKRGYSVVVDNERISWIGPSAQVPAFPAENIREDESAHCFPGS